MRSYRVHACSPEPSGRVPYLVVSVVGAQRVSLDLTKIHGDPTCGELSLALTLDALYDLLQGRPLEVERRDGRVRLFQDGNHLVIQRPGSASPCRVWLAELALAWNMLTGATNPIRGAAPGRPL